MTSGKTFGRGGAKPMAWNFLLLLLLLTTERRFAPTTSLELAPVSRRRFVIATATAATTGMTTGWVASVRSAPARESGDTDYTIDDTVSYSARQQPQPQPQQQPQSLLLLSTIPTMNLGAPATNATVPGEVSRRIEELVSVLEGSDDDNTPNSNYYTRNNAVSDRLSGSWRLLYSNAPEIVGLARGLPLGFELGPVFQPVDTADGIFANDARLEHPYNLATLRTIVVGRVRPGTKGSFNAIGVENTRNNRVDIEFERIVFAIDTFLGRPLEPPIRKTLVPNNNANSNANAKQSTPAALPANDQTYLDESVRIVRGGEGSLFVFARDNGEGSEPLATATATATPPPPPPPTTTTSSNNLRDALLSDPALRPPLSSRVESTPLGDELWEQQQQQQQQQKNGAAKSSVPAEIEFLFRERNKNQR